MRKKELQKSWHTLWIESYIQTRRGNKYVKYLILCFFYTWPGYVTELRCGAGRSRLLESDVRNIPKLRIKAVSLRLGYCSGWGKGLSWICCLLSVHFIKRNRDKPDCSNYLDVYDNEAGQPPSTFFFAFVFPSVDLSFYCSFCESTLDAWSVFSVLTASWFTEIPYAKRRGAETAHW